ncbi:hypothetical protein Emag_000522 [Eimeria magna]
MAPPEPGEENMQENQEGALPEWSPEHGKTKARERSEERGVGVDEQKVAAATAAAAENDADGTPTAANTAEDYSGHASDELLGSRSFSRRPTLTLAELPRRVIECQYAVRGPTVALARELSSRLSDGNNELPFKKLIYVNIGDPQALGQPPISFYRQVLACLMYPPLMGLSLHSNAIENACPIESPQLGAPLGPRPDFCPPEFKVNFPSDVISRAREYLCAVGSVGAYSHSQGVLKLRNIIAQWFTERDGIEAHPDDLFLTDGASAGVARLVEVLHRGPEDGMLVPIPQYPLYAGLLTRIGGRTVGYYLDQQQQQQQQQLQQQQQQQQLQHQQQHGYLEQLITAIGASFLTWWSFFSAAISSSSKCCCCCCCCCCCGYQGESLAEFFGFTALEASGDVGAAADVTAGVSAVDEGLAEEDINNDAEEEEAPVDLGGDKKAPAANFLPKTEEFADLILLERELGGQFLNEQERAQAKLSKLGYKTLRSLLWVGVCIVLLEVLIRVYLRPAAAEVQAAYRVRYPGSDGLSKDLLPIVTIMSSPAAAFLAALLFVLINMNVYKFFSNVLSFELLKLDYTFEMEKRRDEEKIKEEEEEKRRAAAAKQTSSSGIALGAVAGPALKQQKEKKATKAEDNGLVESREEGKSRQQESATDDSS